MTKKHITVSIFIAVLSSIVNTGCGEDSNSSNADCQSTGFVRCNGVCINPMTSNNYCGANEFCENYEICKDTQTCQEGKCSSTPKEPSTACQTTGFVKCNGVCINPMTSNNYCGANEFCENYETCKDTQTCTQGRCRTTTCEPDEHRYNDICEKDSLEHCGEHNFACAAKVVGWKSGTCKEHQCKLSECIEEKHIYQNSCEDDSVINCGEHGISCKSQIAGWLDGTCEDKQCNVSECQPGLHLYNNSCETDDTNNCGNHGIACSTVISGWETGICLQSECKVTGCLQGMHIDDKTCVFDTVDDCGMKGFVCKDQVAGWESGACTKGLCKVIQCIDGYHINAATGECTLDTNQCCGVSCIECTDGKFCGHGQCLDQCPKNTEYCSDACVDIQETPNHCGECGHDCNAEKPENAKTMACSQGNCLISACNDNYHLVIQNNTRICQPDTVYACGFSTTNCTTQSWWKDGTCTNGICVPSACKGNYHLSQNEMGEYWCEPDNALNCGEHGHKCTSNERCEGGQCIQLCSLDETKCDGQKVLRCGEDGKFWQIAECDGIQNKCIVNNNTHVASCVTIECIEPAFKCDGEQLKKCDNAKWINDTKCDDQGLICVPTSQNMAKCIDIGTENEFEYHFVLPHCGDKCIPQICGENCYDEAELKDYKKTNTLKFKPEVSKLDVVFSLDTTNSMGKEVANLKQNIDTNIIPIIRNSVTNSAIGVVRFDDFPTRPTIGGEYDYLKGVPAGDGGYGHAEECGNTQTNPLTPFRCDVPFQLLGQPEPTIQFDSKGNIKTDNNGNALIDNAKVTLVSNNVNKLSLHHGGDISEAGYEALWQIVKGDVAQPTHWTSFQPSIYRQFAFKSPDPNVYQVSGIENYIKKTTTSAGRWGGAKFRDKTLPVVVHITDAPAHDDGNNCMCDDDKTKQTCTCKPYDPAYVDSRHYHEDVHNAYKEKGARIISVFDAGENNVMLSDQLVETSRATDAIVPVCAFQNEDLTWNKCSVTINGHTVTEDGTEKCQTRAGCVDPVDGKCVLSYSIMSGDKLSDTLVSGVEALVKYSVSDVVAVIKRDEETFANSNIDTSCFIKSVEALEYLAPPSEPERSCNPTAVPAMFNNSAYNNGFTNFAIGTSSSAREGAQLHFTVTAMNDNCVAPKDDMQVFETAIDLVNPTTGMSYGEHRVLIVVPGMKIIECKDIVCKDGQNCIEGSCVCAPGRFDCDKDPSNGCESTTDCACTPGETRPCWYGAEQNRNVGSCKDGTQTCATDGSTWGACVGAVYPSQAICDATGLNRLGTDVNCDGISDNDQECITECDVRAGSNSYIGCEYWPAFLQNKDGYSTTTNVYFDLTLVMSNPSQYDTATVYVFDKAAQTASENAKIPKPKYTFELKPGEVRTETLVGKQFGSYVNNVGTGDCTKTPNLQACKDNANNTITNVLQYMMQGTQQASNAFRVVSTNPIVVYQFNPYGKPEAHSADASLLMPRSVLGTEYISMGYDSRTGQTSAVTAKFADAMNIIAVESGTTTVEVVFKAPTVASKSGTTIKAYKAGDKGTFTLNRFDVLSLQQSTSGNSTGTSIAANKKIAVFGSAGCAQVPTDKSACDHLEEQLFPLQAWGTSYAAVKTHQRGTEDDYYYILAQKNDTYVDIQGGVQGKSRTLNAGEHMVINTSSIFAVKSSDPNKPILVGQFMAGSQANAAGKGDPSFILNVPVEQYRSEYSFAIPSGYQEDWVTIIAPGTMSKPPIIKYTGAGHTGYNCSNGKQACENVDISSLPANVFSGWKTLAGSQKVFGKSYVYGYLDLDGGTHNLSSTVQFGVTGYGFFNDTSYGYPIGLDLKPLNAE